MKTRGDAKRIGHDQKKASKLRSRGDRVDVMSATGVQKSAIQRVARGNLKGTRRL